MAAGREAAPSGGRSALAALRLGLARAARDELGMPVLVIGVTRSRVAQDGLEQVMGDERLLILLDGPEGRVGAADLDRSCIAALIQHQTTGQVTSAEPADRPFTNTDAALAAPLLDAAIERACALTELPDEKLLLGGFRFGARAANLRALLLAVDAARFRLFDLTLDFAGGVRQGNLRLLLPEPELAETGELPAGAGRMERVIGAARAELTVNIGRLQLSLTELSRLAPGALLPLEEPLLDRAEVLTIEGRQVAAAHLGQAGGFKAIRLLSAPVVQGGVPQGFEPGAPLPGAEDGGMPPGDFPALATDTADWPGDEAPAMSLPINDDQDFGLDDLSPEDAAQEITELAGLGDDILTGEGGEADWPAMGEGLPALPEEE